MKNTEILQQLIRTSVLINAPKRVYFLEVIKFLPDNLVNQLIALLKEEKKIQIAASKKYETKLKDLHRNSRSSLNKKTKQQLMKIEKYVNHQEIDDIEDILNQI